MRREAISSEMPIAKGCITCKKLHIRCDERQPACKRCINSDRTCEGYVRVSTAHKPTDVTPESVLEFRQTCLPSREHPRKALIALPITGMQEPRFLYSFATVAAKGLAPPDFLMHHILRAIVSGRVGQHGETSVWNEQERKEREKSLIRFHQPVKDFFDLSRPASCPVLRTAFMLEMYRIIMDIAMNGAQSSDKLFKGLFVSNGRAD